MVTVFIVNSHFKLGRYVSYWKMKCFVPFWVEGLVVSMGLYIRRKRLIMIAQTRTNCRVPTWTRVLINWRTQYGSDFPPRSAAYKPSASCTVTVKCPTSVIDLRFKVFPILCKQKIQGEKYFLKQAQSPAFWLNYIGTHILSFKIFYTDDIRHRVCTKRSYTRDCDQNRDQSNTIKYLQCLFVSNVFF